jgi:hypothetical protein
MNQHINSMLEHLSLRRKNSDSAQATSHEKQPDNDHKDVNDVDTMHNKSKNSIFKSLISDNGATNIFQNLIRCPESISSHLSHMSASSSNGSHKIQKNHSTDDDNNNQQALHVTTIVAPSVNESQTYNLHKKRHSTVKGTNGDLHVANRDLSPSPHSRMHRKSSHDIRLARTNMAMPESVEEVGKVAPVKPIKTKNILTDHETFDTLHCRAIDVSTRALSLNEKYVNESHFFHSFHSINYASKNLPSLARLMRGKAVRSLFGFN